ncbi:L-type lectin-domain containing receptor kinase IX.1-like [Bidens hawaiensis]|uniref:L-type lectin-domain containing receptor kinase IX.1-like n=1 Tax=Bidens hawaiensis TaxID=980011 RepID=UPI0040495F5C
MDAKVTGAVGIEEGTLNAFKPMKQAGGSLTSHKFYRVAGIEVLDGVSGWVNTTTIVVCLVELVNNASLSFNFTNFSNSDQLIRLSSGASFSGGEIQLTSPNSLAGQAIYMSPLCIWDNTSRELASFSTSFSFVIDSNGGVNDSDSDSDGFTFFLAQNNSVISGGAAMGLPFNTTSNVSIAPFVAVKFDTYRNNGLDNTSVGDHVGINVNNLTSVRYKQWLTDIPNERASSLDRNNKVVREEGLNYTIDLRGVLSDLVLFGFSAASSFQKYIIKSWMFNSIANIPQYSPNASGISVGLAIGLTIGVGLSLILAFVLWRRKKKNTEEEEEEAEGVALSEVMKKEFGMDAAGPRRFSYQDLARSTNGFAKEGKLGEGGFGGVYKGILKDQNTHVAVKRVSKTSRQGIKEFASEVRVISRLRHRNLVQLIGWCHDKGELLLVYEYMENGNLDLHLFMEKSLLPWGTRYNIAIGLASAIFYLHEECSQTTTKLAGTYGYMAPEYLATGKASKQSDVFSFGVVALEIACGRKPIVQKSQENHIHLIDWVWNLYGGETLLEAVDPRLELSFEEEQIKHLMIVGLWCVYPDSEFRPTMRQAIQVLKYEAPLPILPSKMPVASYPTPPSVSNATFSGPSAFTYSSILHGRFDDLEVVVRFNSGGRWVIDGGGGWINGAVVVVLYQRARDERVWEDEED